MTRPSLRLVHSGKPRTPANVEVHAYVKELEAEEREELRKEQRDQWATVLVFVAAVKLVCWIFGDW